MTGQSPPAVSSRWQVAASTLSPLGAWSLLRLPARSSTLFSLLKNFLNLLYSGLSFECDLLFPLSPPDSLFVQRLHFLKANSSERLAFVFCFRFLP